MAYKPLNHQLPRQQDLNAKEDNGKFPEFKDGDVLIILSSSRRYQLHSETLKSFSPVLSELLAGRYTTKLSNKAIKRGQTVRSRLVAVRNGNGTFQWPPRDLVPLILEPVELDSEGKPKPGSASAQLDRENGLPPDPVFVAFDSVLGAFYGRGIDVGNWERDGLDDILRKAISVVNVAEYLHVEHIITSAIDATLLATGQTFFRAIANNPTAWLEFGFRIQSRPIFREALIHAVGKYNFPETKQAINDGMNKAIVAVLARKGERLQEDVKRTLRDLLSYYPQAMHRINTVGGASLNKFGRASYANDIFWWMAVTIYRSWAADKVAIDATHHAADMGYEFMSLIYRGGDAYIGRAELAEFTKVFPLSGKGLSVIEHHLNEIKEYIKAKYAVPLFRRTCQLDIKQYPMTHFTCVDVNYQDYPFSQALSDTEENTDVGNDEFSDDEDEGDEEEEEEECVDIGTGMEIDEGGRVDG